MRTTEKCWWIELRKAAGGRSEKRWRHRKRKTAELRSMYCMVAGVREQVKNSNSSYEWTTEE